MTPAEETEYNRMCLAVICADEMHQNLTAENERLRAENAREVKRSEDWIAIAQDHCAGRGTAEARLATATAHLLTLLGVHDESDTQAARAFLANQPAAPVVQLGAVRQYDGHAWVRVDSLPPLVVTPAAPARTEAEQAVLDGVKSIVSGMLEVRVVTDDLCEAYDQIEAVVLKAWPELARRGRKP